jgi:pimeloyl-ACP methyl ester carboxylesterase
VRGSIRKLLFGVAAALLVGGSAAAQEMPRSLDDAVKMEAADALPRTRFYDAPSPLPPGQPGDLVAKAASADYALPAGVRAVRILYRSQDASGRPVVSSAVVLIPPGSAPAGGWPVIVWAHGTSGVARQCAPSLMRDVYYGEEGLFPMTRAGFAVIAVDYHGLGTEGVHEYVSKRAQTNDVVFSVPAARAAVAALGPRWVVDGHSQGGLAAWGVAERERTRHDPGYLGAIAVAPASHLDWALTRMAPSKDAAFYLDYMAWAIRARTPTFKPSDMLTGAALARYPDITTKGCFYYAYAKFLGDAAPPRLTRGWDKTAAARRFFSENQIGAHTGGPLLVIGGEGDRTVPIAAVRWASARACARGASLQLRTYPGLDHDPVMMNSTPDQLAWIRDRFAGKPAATTCPVPSPLRRAGA